VWFERPSADTGLQSDSAITFRLACRSRPLLLVGYTAQGARHEAFAYGAPNASRIWWRDGNDRLVAIMETLVAFLNYLTIRLMKA